MESTCYWNPEDTTEGSNFICHTGEGTFEYDSTNCFGLQLYPTKWVCQETTASTTIGSTTSSTTYSNIINAGDILIATFIFGVWISIVIGLIINSMRSRTRRNFTGNNSVDGKEFYDI